MTNRANQYVVATALALMLLAGCDRPPSVEVKDWGLTKKGGEHVLTIEMLPNVVATGGMQGTLKLFYSNGCRGERFVSLSEYNADSALVQPDMPGGTITISQAYTVPEEVAGAQLQLEHKTDRGNIAFFDQAKVINPAAQKKAEKTKCKPAPVERSAPSQSSAETAATIINLRGYLCGRVIDIYPRGPGQLVVNCVEYRNGSGRVKYLLHTDSASVERLD